MTSETNTARMTDDSDKPFRGRRLTWEQFYQQRPDLRPANDNVKGGKDAAA